MSHYQNPTLDKCVPLPDFDSLAQGAPAPARGTTPRTDAKIVSQSFVDETRLFDRCHFIPLLEHARQLERELSSAQEQIAALREALSYAKASMGAFTDHEGNMPDLPRELKNEFDGLKAALHRARAALAATRKEPEHG